LLRTASQFGMLADLVLAGLATVVTETKMAPRGLTIEVDRIRITDGRPEGTRTLIECRSSLDHEPATSRALFRIRPVRGMASR